MWRSIILLTSTKWLLAVALTTALIAAIILPASAQCSATNCVYLPGVGKNMNQGLLGYPLGIMPLVRPEWISPPHVTGTTLLAQWTPVQNAVVYEVMQNSTPTEIGATLFGRYSQNSFSTPFNAATGELIALNPGFESGQSGWWGYGAEDYLVDWHMTDRLFVVSADDKYAGTFSAKGEGIGGLSTGTASLFSQMYSCSPSSAYTLSAYAKRASGDGALRLSIKWYDSSKAAISASLSGDFTPATWTKISYQITSPAGASFFKAILLVTSGATEFASTFGYFDNVSMLGQAGVQPTSYYYAVRPVDQNGNLGQLSSWQTAQLSAAAVGDPTSNHVLIDYANAVIRSSNFATAATGVSISSAGIDGKLLIDPTAVMLAFEGETLWHSDGTPLIKDW